MQTHKTHLFLIFCLLIGIVLLSGNNAFADDEGNAVKTVWQIGKADQRAEGFYLADAGYTHFRCDSVFVVGTSNPATDWTFIQPGPIDGWGGGGEHTNTVIFALKEAPKTGTGTLTLSLADSHDRTPPTVEISINGKAGDAELRKDIPKGGHAGYAGDSDKCKPSSVAFSFPATLLKQGNNEIAVTTVAGSWLVYDALTLTCTEPMETASVADADRLVTEYKRRQAAGNVEEVLVICKTHFDLGYTHLIKDLIPYYRTTMIDRALDVMDASKELPADQRFIWVSPGWVMKKVLEDWDGQTETRRSRLDEAVKTGRLVTHALPFSIEAEALTPEGMSRGFMFSDAFCQQYGLPLARGAKTTDVPSQTTALATVLANSGVQFMQIGCNWPSGYVHDMPLLFWWEGPDGSRVMCMYSSIYGNTTAFWPWQGRNDRGVGQGFRPPKDWPYKTWIAIIVTGDNAGPPSAEGVKAAFEEAQRTMPGVKVRMGTMEEFAEAITAEIKEKNLELPVVRGETPDTWIHGYMSDPRGMQNLRHLGTSLPAVELLNSQLRLAWGLPQTPDAAPEIAVAWENYLLYGEHTWGVSASPREYGEAFYSKPADAYARIESSWEDKTDYVRKAAEIESKIQTSDMRALATAVKHDGPAAVVYNPLPWTRSAWVEVGDKALYAENVPASGYKLVPLPKDEPAVETIAGDVIENEFYRIRLDAAKGGIVSFVDKKTNRDWAARDGDYRLGAYLNERFDKELTEKYCREYQQGRWGDVLHGGMSKPGIPGDVPYRDASCEGGKLTITATAEKQTARLEFPGDPANRLAANTLEVVLYKNSPYVDLTLTIVDKAKDNWPEADWLCLPFNVSNPKFRIARPLGYIDPAKDILKGANRHFYSAAMGVTVTEPSGAGIAMCPLDHEMISLDTPGIWKFSLDFIPQKPTVFLNLYNNQWNTNFRYWYTGTWSSTVRLWTVAEDRGELLNLPSLEARTPMMATVAEGQGGTLPAEQQGISVSKKGVAVTCLGTDLLHGKTVLRLWEMTGADGECAVTFPAAMAVKSVEPINTRGESLGKPIPVVDGKFTYPAKGFGPATFFVAF